MVTDDERRLAAERLRWLAASDLPPWVGYTYEAVMGHTPKVGEGSAYRESSYREYVSRLADLIDPGSRDSSAMRAEADRLRWERHDCDGVARSLRREADMVDAARAAVDRDALLALADEMERAPDGGTFLVSPFAHSVARRIREACGEAANGLPARGAARAHAPVGKAQAGGAGRAAGAGARHEKN